jgi:recombination protein RecA
MRAALLRAQLETALGERASSPFTDVEKRVWECVPSGIPTLDTSIGGLPRGAIVELVGAPSSGRTSLALTILSTLIQHDEVCALVDGTDAFDPESGAAAGIDMRRLLWVRCRNLDQVLRSTDLLLQGGGFGAVALDLSDLPQQAVRGVPLAVWFRFQRVLENTPTVLLLLGRESAAKSAASVVLRANLRKASWNGLNSAPTHGLLLAHTHLDVEVLRIRHSQCRFPKVHHDVRLYSCS